MKTFGQILKELRNIHGVTGEELGKAISVSRNAISNWENNRRTPDSNMIKDIANYFNVSTDYLLGYSQEPKRKGVMIPVLGKVIAGIPIEAVEEILDYEEITPELAKTGAFFALKIQGTSMEPRIIEGDIVIVKQQSDIENGDIAIVLVNGHEATVKKVNKHQDGILLSAFNPTVYSPTFYNNKQIEELPVQIIGKVVELRGKF